MNSPPKSHNPSVRSSAGPPEGPDGAAVARAGAEEEEARETKRRSQSDGE